MSARTSASERCVQLLITGRVQGVFYRASTAEQAETLGLRGWVRNLVDGRVQVLPQGPTEQVAALVAWCHKGPPMARVDDIAALELDARELPAFQVQRGRFSPQDPGFS